MHLVDQIKEKARQNKQTVVLPEGYDDRMVQAAGQIVADGLANVVLLGAPEVLRARAAELGASLDGVTLLEPKAAPQLDAYADELMELRRKKGLTREDALALLTGEDNLYFGAMMVRRGDAGGTVAGYDRAALSTYTWIAQGMIAVVVLFGQFELAQRVRPGDVAVDDAEDVARAADAGRGERLLRGHRDGAVPRRDGGTGHGDDVRVHRATGVEHRQGADERGREHRPRGDRDPRPDHRHGPDGIFAKTSQPGVHRREHDVSSNF